MNLPIRFPNKADVIYEDAARFRALSPEDKVRALEDCFRLYQSLRSSSSDVEEFDRLAEEEERLEWQAVLDFVARHAPTEPERTAWLEKMIAATVPPRK